jgi:ABC-type nitrate/sulfonate/bicarbonate transport system permease component
MFGSSHRKREILVSTLAVACVLGLWEAEAHWLAATRTYGDFLLPSIEHVFGTSIPSMAKFGGESAQSSWTGAAGVIADHSLYTVMRLLVGTALGVAVGVGLGVLISANRLARYVLEPPILVIRNIPLLTLIPLFVLWFGTAEKGKIIYVAFAIAAMIVINTVHAIHNIQPIYSQYARTLGAGKAAIYRTVIIPSILPELLAGIKVSLGVGWAIVLAAEFLAADKGLGKLLILSQTFFDVGRMLVIVLVFIVYSLVLNGIFDAASRRLTRWAPARSSK